MTAQPHTTDTEASAENEATPQPVAELVQLDPRTLAAHPRNIRDDLGDLDGLAASIAAVGVIEALTVVPLPDGGHRIVAGHRRCAAAILADQATVPCLLRPELAADDDDKVGHAGHVARMVGENLHREGITAIEEARAYQTMLELGVSRADIARQTGQPKKRVLKGLGVVKAGVELGESLQAANLTLDQAAAVALYAEDPEVTAELIAAAAQGDGVFAHALSRAKQDRAEQRKVAAAVEALTEAGVTVIDRPDYDSPAAQLHRLTHEGQPLDEDSHKSCPGHAAYVQTGWREDVDVHYVCTDPAGNGHADRYANSRPTTGTAGGPMSDDQKAERRALIESNKAMRAATETRRAFVRDYLNRRSAPKGVLRYVVDTMLGQRWSLARWFNGMANQVEISAREELGITTGPFSDARLPLAALAQVAGAIESGIHPQSWRNPDASVAEWFRFLVGQGYELADIEQHIVDAVPAKAAPVACQPPPGRPLAPILTGAGSHHMPGGDQLTQRVVAAVPENRDRE